MEGLDEEEHAAVAREELELSRMRLSVVQLEREVALENEAIADLEQQRGSATASLETLQDECAALTAQLHERQRMEARQVGLAKLLKLQLTIATQLHGVAEHLSKVSAAGTALREQHANSMPTASLSHGSSCAMTADCASGSLAEVLHTSERETQELRRALKRQQQLVSDAHRQLLELSTRRNPRGAAAAAPDVATLRAALAEQEMARLMAEARCDELQSQVRLLEEQGLRRRLHPLPDAHQARAPVIMR